MRIQVIKDSIIYANEVHRLNSTFSCDDAIAESLINRGYAVKVADDTPDLYSLSYQDIKKLAVEVGIPAKGTKEDLIAAILAEAEKVSLEEDPNEDDEEEADEEYGDEEELPNTSMPE